MVKLRLSRPVWRAAYMAAAGTAALAAGGSLPAADVVPHETVEWTWAEFPQTADPHLPDVLIEGDSISRNYYPNVVRLLAGQANVFLFATSASVGDPSLPAQLRDYQGLAKRRFRVVHFSNGLHGWGIAEPRYAAAFPAYIAALRRIAPGARLIWTTTTFMRALQPDGGSNARVEARNAAVQPIVARAGMRVDDQNGLMRGRTALYQDDVHFGPAGSAIQARQAADMILASLGAHEKMRQGDR